MTQTNNHDGSDRWEANNYGRSMSSSRISYDDASTFGGSMSRGGFGGSSMISRSRSSDEFDNSAARMRGHRGYSDDGGMMTPHTLSDGEIEEDSRVPIGEIGWNVNRSGLRTNSSMQHKTYQSSFFEE